MYRQFYRLREGPFALTPDPKYLFLGASHKEALASVAYGIQERKGFVLILGEVGTGKTTLVRHILKQFGDTLRVVYIFNTCTSFEELLRVMLRELEIPGASGERLDMIDALNGFLLSEAAAGRYVVMIIDEAQHLTTEILEEIRMLSNLETASGKLLQLILVGQPELGEKLGQWNLRQLRQRIALAAELKALSQDETVAYIAHRLKIAGYTGPPLFTRRAVRRIHRESDGLPRLINVLCDKALLLGYGASAKRIGVRLVKQAAKDREIFGRSSRPAPVASAATPQARRRPALVPILGLGTAAALGVLLGAGWHSDVGTLRRSLDRVTPSGSSAPAIVSTAAVRAASLAEPAPVAAPSVAASQPLPPVPASQPLPAAPVRADRADLSATELRFTRSSGPEPGGTRVSVVAGDRLAALIVDTYGRVDLTLLDFVKDANPNLRDIDVISVGQQLRLPPLVPESMVLAADGGRYAVHVTTVPTMAAANSSSLRGAVRRVGVELHVVPVDLGDGVQVYRLIAGYFRERAEAEAFAAAFSAAKRSRAGR